jgi:hypothetical protein
MMIGSCEVGVGGVNMGECVLKPTVESLAFFVIPSNHRAGVVFLGGGSGSSGVRVRFEGCFPNDG